MTREEAQEEVNKENKKVGYSRHKVRQCIQCEEFFVGGTNGVYCHKCFYHKEDRFKLLKNQCKFCGRKTNLHIHHIDNNHSNNHSNNKIELCYLCHSRLHSFIYSKLKWK